METNRILLISIITLICIFYFIEYLRYKNKYYKLKNSKPKVFHIEGQDLFKLNDNKEGKKEEITVEDIKQIIDN